MPEDFREDLDKKVHRFLACFYQVSYMAELYDVQNKVFTDPVSELVQQMEQILPDLGEIAIQEVDHHLIFNGRRLKSDAAAFMRHRQLVDWLASHQIRTIIFRASLTDVQWKLLLSNIARSPRNMPEAYDQLVDALRRDGLSAVELVKREAEVSRAQVKRIELNRRHFALQAQARTAALLKMWATFEGVPVHRDFLYAKLYRCVQDLVTVCLNEDWKYFGLVNNRVEGDDLFQNATTVATLSIVMGIRAGFHRPQLLDLAMSALVRNLGVAFLPADLLSKSGVFTPEERQKVARHPLLGIRSILGSRQYHEGLLKRILVMSEHREAEAGITHPFSRIVAVAERFNALTRRRPYRYAFLPDAAVNQIAKMAGSQLDADAVHLLVHAIGVYPPGTLVRLTSGELAVVFHPNQDRMRFREPFVRIVKDAQGEGVWPPPVVDLATTAPSRSIAVSLDPAEHGISVGRVLAEEETVKSENKSSHPGV